MSNLNDDEDFSFAYIRQYEAEDAAEIEAQNQRKAAAAAAAAAVRSGSAPLSAESARAGTAQVSTTKQGSVWAEMSKDGIIEMATQNALDGLDVKATPEQIRKQIIDATNTAFQIRNTEVLGLTESGAFPKAAIERFGKLQPILSLEPAQIAMVLTRRYTICEVTPGGTSAGEMGVLAEYQFEGENEGIYLRADDGLLQRQARKLAPGLSDRAYKEVESLVRGRVERREENTDKNLIMMQNGIFDYKKKDLQGFTPEVVSLSKIAAKMPSVAPPVPVIKNADGTSWNLEEWLQELFPEEDNLILLLQIIGAALRPGVPWDTIALFIAENGSNGKGTILQLIRSLIGDGNVCSIPLSKFSERFALSSLVSKQVNLVDENDAGAYIAKAADLKAIACNDPVTIDRKHKDPLHYKPRNFNIQSMNEHPKFKDKSAAMLRRMLFVKFLQRFMGKEKNSAIKSDYVNRAEVHEWIVWKVLMEMQDYYEFDIPESSRIEKENFRLDLDPVAAFWEKYEPQTGNVFLPVSMVYALYVADFKATNPSGTPASQAKFTRDLNAVMDPDVWFMPKDSSNKGRLFTVAKWFEGRAEPMLLLYERSPDVQPWLDPYDSDFANTRANKVKRDRGWVRRKVFELHELNGTTPNGNSGEFVELPMEDALDDALL